MFMDHYICFFENAIKKIKQLWMRIGSFQPKIPPDSKNLANLGEVAGVSVKPFGKSDQT
jgi:hypothetical protein